MDHGALPGCSEEVKSKFGVVNLGFGALGTSIYFGVTIGCVITSKVLNDYGSKQYILSGFMFFNALGLLAFTMTPNFTFSLIMRLITGFFQSIFMIYGPVWSDGYAS